MCGTPDFSALTTCLVRITAISAAGGISYAIYKMKNILPKLLESKILDEQRKVLHLDNIMKAGRIYK